MKELWSRRDEDRLRAFLEAVGAEDLPGALFVFEGIPERVRTADEALLAHWADRVRQRRAGVEGPPLEEARDLAAVLGAELGFSGDADDYYDPRNCLLHEVLERRRGMPILLSVVWIEVGRRAGLVVQGVGMPGHFIVRVGAEDGVLADPFAGGAILTVEECRQKVRELAGGKLPWKAGFLAASPAVAILERILHNLSGCYGRAGDEGGRFRAVSFLSALRPDEPDNLLARAEIADAAGARELALRIYAEILERFPESSQAQAASEKMTGTELPPAVN
jgi:regulator of sirC expression with transglutaminase-like and TPR domain